MVTKRIVTLYLAFALTSSVVLPAQASGYSGEESRPIKAYSTAELQDLHAGKGMGFAKTAELNGYPGPAHVLQHAMALRLTDEQRLATEQLIAAHRARAQALGETLLQAETRLEEVFAHRTVNAEVLEEMALAVGRQQALLRAEHLRTHLAQTTLLNAEQIKQYSALQGYTDSASPQSAPRHSHH